MEKREERSSWEREQIQPPSVSQEVSEDLGVLQPQQSFKTLGGMS